MDNIVEKPKKVRQSGIELLRVLTACAVVMLHYNDGRAFVHVLNGSLNHTILMFLESLCIGAVDIFILISGYFLCKSPKRSIGKIVDLFLQLILFRVVFYLANVIIGGNVFSIKYLIKLLIPNSYFVILYTALYFVSPYINILFEKFSYKEWKKFIVVLIVTFSVWPILVDLLKEVSGMEWTGISTITSTGNHKGFTIVNFVLLYCVGAFLRYNDIKVLKKSNCLIGIFICTFVIFGWSCLNNKMTIIGLRSAWVYHNPFVILLSVFIFSYFNKISFTSRIVNDLAKASFTCFLIHSYFLRYIKIDYFVKQPFYIMGCHIVVSMICIYLASYIVYKVYNACTSWIVKKLEKCSFSL